MNWMRRGGIVGSLCRLAPPARSPATASLARSATSSTLGEGGANTVRVYNNRPFKYERDWRPPRKPVKPPPPKPSPASFVNGIISVNKPVSWTSNEVVTKIRNTISAHLLQENPGVGKKACKIRVGHGGTLDPVATGVLVIGIGKGTKALGTFLKGEKSYKAVGQFGYETDTCDVEGQMQGEAKSYDHVTQEMIEGVLEKFRGKIQQSPPRFSAVRKNGRRAYEWAREGQDVSV